VHEHVQWDMALVDLYRTIRVLDDVFLLQPGQRFELCALQFPPHQTKHQAIPEEFFSQFRTDYYTVIPLASHLGTTQISRH
jgi:hypothetical protein